MKIRTATTAAALVGSILVAPVVLAAPALAHAPGATAQTGTSAYCTGKVETLNLRGTLRFVPTSQTTKATGEHRHNGRVQMRVVRDGRASWVNGVSKSVVCRKAYRTVLAGVAWKVRTVPTAAVSPTSITLPSAALDHGNAPSRNPNLGADATPITVLGND